MPPKYSHVKKRSAAGLLRTSASTASNLIRESYDPHAHQPQYQQHIQLNTNHFPILGIQPNSILPNISKDLSQAMAAVAHLERSIARLLLLRFEWDMARLYSTRLFVLAITAVPVLVARLAEQGGPGWVAMNSESEEVKEFFRQVIAMDMREAGERVATKSVLWSYTALRRFSLAHNVPISPEKGLHSIRLLPFFPDLKAHVDWLESQPSPVFEKPGFFGGLEQGYRILEEACVEMGFDLGIDIHDNYDLTIPSTVSVLHPDGAQFPAAGGSSNSGTTTTEMLRASLAENPDLANAAITYTLSPTAETRLKLRLGYTRLVQTMWKVAREFDVRGYGQVLRDKLTVKWCECGCSTEHLGEVCEKTVREEEEEREKHKDGIWGGGDITVDAYGPFILDDKWGDIAKGKGVDASASSAPALQTRDTNANGKSVGKKKTKPPPVDEEKLARYAELKKLVWDGRGSGVYAWETYNEEDIWEVELDFGTGKNRKKRAPEPEEDAHPLIPGWRQIPRSVKRKKKFQQKATAVFLEDLRGHGDDDESQNGEQNPFEEEEAQMTIGEMMEWRYIKAEQVKELGNTAFNSGRYNEAVVYYRQAQEIEPELPHYTLNLAAAYLKLNQWIDAEKACTRALLQHRSSKGLWRRAKAREMQGKFKDAIEDYRALIRLQPYNTNAMMDLLTLLHRPPEGRPPDDATSPEDNPWGVDLRPQTEVELDALYKKLGMTKPKRPKPIPFARTMADDAYLSILPVDPRTEALNGTSDTWGANGVNGSGSGATSAGTVTMGDEDEGGLGAAGKGKLKSGKARGKEKREDLGRSGLMKSAAPEYGVLYFTWDRYVVRRAD